MPLAQIDTSAVRSAVSSAVDTVQFLQPASVLFIYNLDPVATLYYRADGIDPVVEGDGSKIVPANTRMTILVVDQVNPEVRVISSSLIATRYAIERVQP